MKLMYAFILTITLAGCDDVFGLTGYERACELRTFAGAPTQLASGDDVSRDDAGLLVGVSAGLPFEVAPGGSAQPIDLGVYVPVGVSLSPEGDELFYSAEVEPPLLQLAHRATDDRWTVGGAVPAGRFAGSPTAAELGPRHVLVRTSDATTDVQEYVETDRETWAATGAVMQVPSVFAPSLLPNGLTLVYATTEEDATDEPGVYAAQRDAVDDRFGAPRRVLAGMFGAAQLTPLCDQLVTADADTRAIEVFR